MFVKGLSKINANILMVYYIHNRINDDSTNFKTKRHNKQSGKNM